MPDPTDPLDHAEALDECRDEAQPPRQVGLCELAVALVRKANFTYGGGSATIATLHRDLVERREWVTEEPFQLSYALSRLTPGTNLLAFEACIGYVLRRKRGALIALLAGSIPCALMALAATAVYDAWSHDTVVRVAIRGALAAAVAVTIMTGVVLIRPHWRTAGRAKLVVFVCGAFATVEFTHLNPLVVLLASGAAGLLWPTRSQS